MPVDVTATIAGLDALGVRVDAATKEITGGAAHLIQLASMKEAPVGVVGNSTNAPGDLARSIDVQGPVGGDGVYEAKVGPTVIYGRQRELGGEIFPNTSTYLHFFRWGDEVFTTRVYQEPEPYMKPGRAAALAPIEVLAIERIRVAITGAD